MTTDPKLPACQRRCKALEESSAQLLKQNKELREALESAKRGNNSLKMLIDVLEVRNHELYNAISHISRQNNYGYIKDYAKKTLSKHPNK